MVKINTRHFGELEVEDEKAIRFPNGIVGFPEANRFFLLNLPDIEPYQWLQCADNPELSFIVVPVLMLKPDYKLHMTKADHKALGFERDECPLLLSIVVLPDNPINATVNLLAPIAINEEKQLAAQVVNECRDYRTRHNIRDELQNIAREGKDHACVDEEEKSVVEAGG